jgi:hypothetical protein
VWVGSSLGCIQPAYRSLFRELISLDPYDETADGDDEAILSILEKPLRSNPNKLFPNQTTGCVMWDIVHLPSVLPG